MVQLDKSVGKQVSATAALEKAGSLYEVYLSIRAVWRQSEKELNLSKTDVN